MYWRSREVINAISNLHMVKLLCDTLQQKTPTDVKNQSRSLRSTRPLLCIVMSPQISSESSPWSFFLRYFRLALVERNSVVVKVDIFLRKCTGSRLGFSCTRVPDFIGSSMIKLPPTPNLLLTYLADRAVTCLRNAATCQSS